jgi:myosin-5
MSFHVFYHVVAGADARERDRWQLGSIHNHHYTNQSGYFAIPGQNPAKLYIELRQGITLAGLNLVKQEHVFRTCAAIVHLGNVQFDLDADPAAIPNEDQAN